MSIRFALSCLAVMCFSRADAAARHLSAAMLLRRALLEWVVFLIPLEERTTDTPRRRMAG